MYDLCILIISLLDLNESSWIIITQLSAERGREMRDTYLWESVEREDDEKMRSGGKMRMMGSGKWFVLLLMRLLLLLLFAAFLLAGRWYYHTKEDEEEQDNEIQSRNSWFRKIGIPKRVLGDDFRLCSSQSDDGGWWGDEDANRFRWYSIIREWTEKAKRKNKLQKNHF